MALDFSNIHSLNKYKKTEKNKNGKHFSFERESVFSINLPENLSIFPFYGKKFSLNNAVFFDTETTGLSHGAGNMVFLAGIGFVENNRFVVKQYFVSTPPVEFQLVETLVNLFSERKIVITYNGKCFDIPVIKTRCALHGILEPDIEQIDLYHISRFIWRDRLKSFRLVDVEREVLNFERKGDLPGSMAPFAYRQFILRGETGLLERVFKHNLRDVYSLLHLFLKVCDKGDVDVLFASARRHFLDREYLLSLEVLRKLLPQVKDKQIKQKIYILAAECLKKKGEVGKAVSLWKRVGDVNSHIEIAKFYEHREKDFSLALKHTEIALRKAKSQPQVFKELIKRRERLIKKLGLSHRD